MEHETLDKDEVGKVIKGEPIRGIVEVLEEVAAEPSRTSGALKPTADKPEGEDFRCSLRRLADDSSHSQIMSLESKVDHAHSSTTRRCEAGR